MARFFKDVGINLPVGTTPTGALEIRPSGNTNVLNVNGLAGHTANLQEWAVNSSAVANLTAGGVFNSSTGYRIANTAASGNYLRGNGTNFVSAVIAQGDLPTTIGDGTKNDGHASASIVDFLGSYISIGDKPSGITLTNGIGIKFHDGGVAHASMRFLASTPAFQWYASGSNSTLGPPDGAVIMAYNTSTGALTLSGTAVLTTATGIELADYTAKGAILGGTGVGTFANVGAIGANNTVLMADSATATGMKWGSVAVIETVSVPVALGVAAVGAGTTASAFNHVHPTTGLGVLATTNTWVETNTFSKKNSSSTTNTGALTVGDALNIIVSTGETTVQVGNTSAVSEMFIGQANARALMLQWIYNATAASATAEISTFSGNNPLLIQDNVGALTIAGAGGTLGFYGTTPAVQTTGSTDILAGLVTLGLRAASSNPPLNMGSGTLTAGSVSATGLTVSAGSWRVDSAGRVAGINTGIDAETALYMNGAHPGTAATLYGLRLDYLPPNTTTNSWSVYSRLRTGAAFAMTQGINFLADSPSRFGGSSITSAYGFYAQRQGDAGVTNAFGMYIAPQTTAVTLNVAARFDSSTTAALWLGGGDTNTTVAGGITFGSGRDVNIFRSAANTINITATGTPVLQVGGNTVWHAGNDGAGSGLDADLLDGLSSTAFILDSDYTAKGIVLAGTGVGTHGSVGTIGANNTVLMADSATATGMKWGSVAVIETVSVPVALGAAAVGAGTTASAFNHVHPTTGLALLGSSNAFTVGGHTITDTAGAGLQLEKAADGDRNFLRWRQGTTHWQMGFRASPYSFVLETQTTASPADDTGWTRAFAANTAGLVTLSNGAIGPLGSNLLELNNTASGIVLGTVAATGTALTVLRSDATIAAFDATVPAALGAAAAGAINFAARRDHVHPTTGLALLAGGNTFSGAQVFGGSTQIDANGKIGLLQAASASALIWNNVAHTGSTVTLWGILMEPIFPATTTTSAYAVWGRVVTAASAFTVVDAAAFRAGQITRGAGSTITNAYGMYIDSQTATGVTNAYGLRVDGSATQTVWIAASATPTTAAEGIAFGSARDATLFRSAANVLGSTSGIKQTLAGDVVGLEIIANASQTANIMNIVNSGATRSYLAWDPEVIHNQSAIYFQPYSTAVTTGLTAGFRCDFNLVPAGAVATSQYNLVQTTVVGTPAHAWTNDIAGLIGQVGWSSTGTHTVGALVGLKGYINAATGGSGLVTNAYSVLAAAQTTSNITNLALFKATAPAGAGTITNMYGMWIDTIPYGGTISVGARIDGPTGTGSSKRAALWLEGSTDTTGAVNGIIFGQSGDTNLFRAAANQLQTDDNFVVGATGWIAQGSGIFGYNTILTQQATNAVGVGVRGIAAATADVFRIETPAGNSKCGADQDSLWWDQNSCRSIVGASAPGVAATAMVAYGTAATITVNGTPTDGVNAFGKWIKYASGNVSGNIGGIQTAAFTWTRRQWYPEFHARIHLDDAAITTNRIWVGLVSAALTGKDAPTTESCAAFRYATTVDGTAFWRCVTHDGGATPTVTTTVQPVAVNTVSRLRITVDDANARVRFYINDALVGTHTTALPAAATPLGWQITTTTQAAAIRNIRVNSWKLRSD